MNFFILALSICFHVITFVGAFYEFLIWVNKFMTIYIFSKETTMKLQNLKNRNELKKITDLNGQIEGKRKT